MNVVDGCQGQHIPVEMQRKAKEKALFSRLSKLQEEPIQLMPMICGEQWAYRRRVRLSLLWNAKAKPLNGISSEKLQSIGEHSAMLSRRACYQSSYPKIDRTLDSIFSPETIRAY